MEKAASESVPTPTAATSSKSKRKAPLDPALVAAIPAACQQLMTAGYIGVATSLQQDGLPLESTIQKALADNPPYLHWPKSDMAPSFRVDNGKLTLVGALRGYRMARASHGVNASAYYYECILLPPPKASELLNSLPSSARLGSGLREKLEAAVAAEQALPDNTAGKKRKLEDDVVTTVSHVRLGWSMRTADLQAPVGYDKWSYGIRSVNGALIHESMRRDSWGGEGFGEGDVVGCYISLDGDSCIRFFKNGECMGEFVIAKGKLDGGFAFEHITPGTYYPSVSTYMGASVRANFGPYFIHPPKKRLGIQLKPISTVRPAPLPVAEAVTLLQPTIKLFKKTEHQNAVKRAIEYEAGLQVQAHSDFMANHIAEVRHLRQTRGVSMTDLPPPRQDEI